MKLLTHFFILILISSGLIFFGCFDEGLNLIGTSIELNECNEDHLLDNEIIEDVTFRVIVKNSNNLLLEDTEVEVTVNRQDCTGLLFERFSKTLFTTESGSVEGYLTMNYKYDTDIGEWIIVLPNYNLVGHVERFSFGDQFLQTTVIVETLED